MIHAIIGGAMIGAAASLFLFFNGRVMGVSGILGSLLKPTPNDISWRVMFVLGLVSGGLALQWILPQSLIQQSTSGYLDYVLAGLLVGFGTLLGNGCTSGHGVCGISRLSIRSILSTVTFMGFGIVSVLLFKWLRSAS